MTYNESQLQSVTNTYDIFKYANDSTTGLLFILFIIAIFFVMLMALKRYDFSKAFFASSFICFVLSSYLTYIKLLNFIFPLGFLIMIAFAALYVYSVPE